MKSADINIYNSYFEINNIKFDYSSVYKIIFIKGEFSIFEKLFTFIMKIIYLFSFDYSNERYFDNNVLKIYLHKDIGYQLFEFKIESDDVGILDVVNQLKEKLK